MTVAEMNEPAAAGIKAIIGRKGLRQNWVAERAGLTEQQLSDSLIGRRLLKVCELQPLANALGVGLGEIFAEGFCAGATKPS